MKLTFFIGILMFFNVCNAQGQGFSQEKFLDSLGLEFNLPKYVILNGSTDCYNENPILKKVLTCQINRFEIAHQECRIYMEIVTYLSYHNGNSDSYFDQGSILDPDPLINKVKTDLKIAYPDYDSTTYKKSVKIYEKTEAERLFNTDFALEYVIKLPEPSVLDHKYSYIRVFMMQKKGFPMQISTILYNRKSKRFIEKKRKEIYQSFRYKNENLLSDLST